MPRIPECAAEKVLIDAGIAREPGLVRRAIIGCIGCKWLKAEANGRPQRTHVYEIAKCSGLNSSVVQPTMKKLAQAGAAERITEDATSGSLKRPSRVYYVPSDTELGNRFKKSLEIPPVCDLEEVVNL